MVPVLDQWVGEGKKIKEFELQRIVKTLRARKRYKQALEVSENFYMQRPLCLVSEKCTGKEEKKENMDLLFGCVVIESRILHKLR